MVKIALPMRVLFRVSRQEGVDLYVAGIEASVLRCQLPMSTIGKLSPISVALLPLLSVSPYPSTPQPPEPQHFISSALFSAQLHQEPPDLSASNHHGQIRKDPAFQAGSVGQDKLGGNFTNIYLPPSPTTHPPAACSTPTPSPAPEQSKKKIAERLGVGKRTRLQHGIRQEVRSLHSWRLGRSSVAFPDIRIKPMAIVHPELAIASCCASTIREHVRVKQLHLQSQPRQFESKNRNLILYDLSSCYA